MERSGIKVNGHVGKWYVIDEGTHNGKQVYLLEHETHGDGAAAIIVDAGLNIVMEDVYNGLDDLQTL